MQGNSKKNDTGGINHFYLLLSGTGIIMRGYIKTYVPRTLSLKDLQSQHLTMQLRPSNSSRCHIINQNISVRRVSSETLHQWDHSPFPKLSELFFSWILRKMRVRQWCIIFYHLTLDRKLRSPEAELKHRGIWEIATFFSPEAQLFLQKPSIVSCFPKFLWKRSVLTPIPKQSQWARGENAVS